MSDFAGDVEFQKLLQGQADVDLVRLQLELAADAYPEVDHLGCLLEIDHLAVACGDQLEAVSPQDMRGRLAAISRVLYEVEGFHGNRESYYEPENSYLNRVLARRCGIPISLGILYMAVASRVGVNMFGTNAPSHFVIGCTQADQTLFVDPFNGGEILDREGCERRIHETIGREGIVCDVHLRPATALETAVRVLRNLKAAYARASDWRSALPVQQRLIALLPCDPQEKRDLGLIYLRAGLPKQALAIFEQFAANGGQQHAAALAIHMRTARKLIAEMN